MGAGHPHRTLCARCRCTFVTDRCPAAGPHTTGTFALNRLCDCYACDPRTRPLYLEDLRTGRIRPR